MFKLKDLIDEKKYKDNAKNRALDRVGAEWGADKGDGKKKDKKSKEDKPKTPGLGGGWDKHDGPEDKDDAVGKGEDADPQKESAIVRGIRAMATTNSERDRDDQETAVDIEGEDGPTTNLCDVEVPGTNMFCGDPLATDEHPNGIPRVEMPQLKSKPLPGSKAEKLVKQGKLKQDSKGEVNAEDLFKAKLEEEGIEMSEPKPMNVSELKATQNELKPSNIAFMVDVLMTATPPASLANLS